MAAVSENLLFAAFLFYLAAVPFLVVPLREKERRRTAQK